MKKFQLQARECLTNVPCKSKSLVGYPYKFVADHLSGGEDVEPPPLPEPPRVEVSATSFTPRRDTATLEDSTSPKPLETASALVASMVTPEPKGIGCEHGFMGTTYASPYTAMIFRNKFFEWHAFIAGPVVPMFTPTPVRENSNSNALC